MGPSGAPAAIGVLGAELGPVPVWLVAANAERVGRAVREPADRRAGCRGDRVRGLRGRTHVGGHDIAGERGAPDGGRRRPPHGHAAVPGRGVDRARRGRFVDHGLERLREHGVPGVVGVEVTDRAHVGEAADVGDVLRHRLVVVGAGEREVVGLERGRDVGNGNTRGRVASGEDRVEPVGLRGRLLGECLAARTREPRREERVVVVHAEDPDAGIGGLEAREDLGEVGVHRREAVGEARVVDAARAGATVDVVAADVDREERDVTGVGPEEVRGLGELRDRRAARLAVDHRRGGGAGAAEVLEHEARRARELVLVHEVHVGARARRRADARAERVAHRDVVARVWARRPRSKGRARRRLRARDAAASTHTRRAPLEPIPMTPLEPRPR